MVDARRPVIEVRRLHRYFGPTRAVYDMSFEVYAGEELVETAEIRVQSLPLEGTQLGLYVTTLDPGAHTIQGRLESLQFP